MFDLGLFVSEVVVGIGVGIGVGSTQALTTYRVYPMECAHSFVCVLFLVVMISVLTDSFMYPYRSGLLHWHWGNHTIAPVPLQ